MTPGAFLTTDRLRFRRFTEADAEILFELDSDPEVMRYVGPFTLPTVEAYRAKLRDEIVPYYERHPGLGTHAAEELATGAFVGWFIFRRATDYRFAAEARWTDPTAVEIGYRLRRPAWGRGYASEGSRALVELAVANPAVSAVVAAALVTNRASCRVLEKVGLTRDGEFVLPLFADPIARYGLRANPG